MYTALIKLSKENKRLVKKKRAKDLNRRFIREEKRWQTVCEKMLNIVNHSGNQVNALGKD